MEQDSHKVCEPCNHGILILTPRGDRRRLGYWRSAEPTTSTPIPYFVKGPMDGGAC